MTAPTRIQRHARSASIALVMWPLGTLVLTSVIAGCQTVQAPKTWQVQHTALSLPWSKDKADKPAVSADDPTEKRSWAWPWSREKTDEDRSLNDVAGPLQRLTIGKQQPVAETAQDTADLAKIRQARDIIDEAQRSKKNDEPLEEAADLLEDIVKNRDPKKFSWKKVFTLSDDSKRPAYDPIRAEAAFYLGESYMLRQQQRYARNYYKLIVKDYPSTPYVDRSSRRLFEIARQWLGDQDFATSDDVAQVNLEEPEQHRQIAKSEAPHRYYHVNLTDKSRPRMDTNGYAIDALRTIWTYDSTGPLADDALMLAATHHLREGENVESDRLFTLLREQFPKSPHLQAAFVLGSHVKLASYQGAAYDEDQLIDAKSLKESTLRLFPDAPEADRIRRELQGIQEAEAQRLWERAKFWEKKNKRDAVRVYCKQVVEQFPDSKYAELARQKLAELGDAQASRSLPQIPSPKRFIKPFQSEPETEPKTEAESPPSSSTDETAASTQPSGKASLSQEPRRFKLFPKAGGRE